MKKIVLKHGAEIEILDGASIGRIEAVVADFAGLKAVADALKEEGNLTSVQFATDGTVTGEYEDMVLNSPLFTDVDELEDGRVTAAFSLRQKSELEVKLEQMTAMLESQESAISDLGDVINEMFAGGELEIE